MQQIRYAFLPIGLVLAVTVTARADDRAAAQALVDKAIQAHGGKAQLAKFPAVTYQLKGTFHGLGEAFSFTGEVATHGPDLLKFVLETEADDQKVRFVNVLNGTKGWFKFNDHTEKLEKEDLADAKEEAYGEWVASLAPLREKTFVLACVGEVNIDKRPALGVKVSNKGHSDITLYFDKQTGLLVKTETRVKEYGKEALEETFLSNYKVVQGTRQAMKFTTKRAGKLYMEGDITHYHLAETLDDSVFAKP